MASINVANSKFEVKPQQSSMEQLKRYCTACLLWEDTAYTDGVKLAEKIFNLARTLPIKDVTEFAIKLRTEHGLRHVPLLLLTALFRRDVQSQDHAQVLRKAVSSVVTRADQAGELIAIYWAMYGKKPIPFAMKKGLYDSLSEMSEYKLGKYVNRGNIKLRDVLRLIRVKPKTEEISAKFSKIVKGELEVPATWEKRLSMGSDKKKAFEELLTSNELGKLALLRNLRNMTEAKVDRNLVKESLMSVKSKEKIFPYQYITAFKAAPSYIDSLEKAMFEDLKKFKKFNGVTVIMVDVSGSMSYPLSSGKSHHSGLVSTRLDAAHGLAISLRELCEQVDIFSFSNKLVKIDPYRGFGLAKIIDESQPHSGTELIQAVNIIVNELLKQLKNTEEVFPLRVIVITDEQDNSYYRSDKLQSIKNSGINGYIMNVSCEDKSVVSADKNDGWVVINGFSQSVLEYIHELENPTF